MLIYRVNDVTVFQKPNSNELLIHANGIAASSGWTNPRLDNSADPNPQDAVIELGFEAERPAGPSMQVLTPVFAAITVKPSQSADVVLVKARTNSISVHASQFAQPPSQPGAGAGAGTLTTLMRGEETPPGPTTMPSFEEQPTTFVHAEEMFPTTFRFGEEGPQPTTLRMGEEGPMPTTLMQGEEGPWTNPQFDDPAGGDPFGGGGNPFGGY